MASDRTGFVGGLLRALSGSTAQHGAQRERHRRAASSSAFGAGWASDSWDLSGLDESGADDTCASTAAEEPRQALRGARLRGAGRSFDSARRRHAGGRGGTRGGAERESTSAADGGDTEESSWPGGHSNTSSYPAAAIRSPFSDHSRYRLAGLRGRAAAGYAAVGQLPYGGAPPLSARLEQRSPTTETEGYDRAADTETGPAEAADVSASEQEAAAGEAAAAPACMADAAAVAAEPAVVVQRSWLLRPWAGVKRGMRRRAANA